jgi:hypothetical protein
MERKVRACNGNPAISIQGDTVYVTLPAAIRRDQRAPTPEPTTNSDLSAGHHKRQSVASDVRKQRVNAPGTKVAELPQKRGKSDVISTRTVKQSLTVGA